MKSLVACKAYFIMAAVLMLAFSSCRSVDEVGEIEVIFNGEDGASIRIYQNDEIVFDATAYAVDRLAEDISGELDGSIRYSGSRFYKWTEEIGSFLIVRYNIMLRPIDEVMATTIPIKKLREPASNAGEPFMDIGLNDYELVSQLKPDSRESVMTHYFLIREGVFTLDGVDREGSLIGRMTAKLEVAAYLGL